MPLPIIDADASQVAVYWITQRGGTVMRVAK